MQYFSGCAVSSTGTYVPIEGEFVLTTINSATLLTHDKKATGNTGGVLTVTTHRIIYLDSSRTRGIAAWLAHLAAGRPLEDKASPFHDRVLLHFGPGVRVEFRGPGSGKDRERFKAQVYEGLRRKEWEAVARAKAAEKAKKKAMEQYVPRQLGTKGVVERVEKRNQEQGNAIVGGFASLEKLRGQAADLVRIAEAFKGKKMEGQGEEENELVQMMAEMGMESPVTRETTGGNVRAYREELARQMGPLLQRQIVKVGGMMTLTDAYCVMMRNRATTELVSPEDFRAACDLLGWVGLRMRTIRLENGALALETEATEDGSWTQEVLKTVDKHGSVTEMEVMRSWGVPIQRARAMLEQTERHGLLVRDETTEGIRFFPNEFEKFASRTPSPTTEVYNKD